MAIEYDPRTMEHIVMAHTRSDDGGVSGCEDFSKRRYVFVAMDCLEVSSTYWLEDTSYFVDGA